MKPRTAFLLIAPLTAIAIGVFQQHRLAEMQRTLSSLRATAEDPSSGPSTPGNQTAGSRGKKPPTAGISNLSEITHLIRDQASVDHGNSNLDPDTREAGMRRLNEFFLKIDAAAAALLFQELASDPASQKLAGNLFSEMNPQQSLLYHLSRDEDRAQPDVLARELGAWTSAAPVEALSWYRDALGKEDPLISLPAFKTAILASESRVDPTQAVQDAIELLTKDPNALSSVMFLDTLKGNEECRRFLLALNEASKDPEKAKFAGRIREMLIPTLSARLREEPFAASVKLLDEVYTEKDRLQFSRLAEKSGREDEKWAAWFAQLPLRIDDGNPVVQMSIDSARKGKDPAWLTQLPAGELKNLAIYRYLQRQPDASIATTWISRLPEGPIRTALEEDLHDGWKNHGKSGSSGN